MTRISEGKGREGDIELLEDLGRGNQRCLPLCFRW